MSKVWTFAVALEVLGVVLDNPQSFYQIQLQQILKLLAMKDRLVEVDSDNFLATGKHNALVSGRVDERIEDVVGALELHGLVERCGGVFGEEGVAGVGAALLHIVVLATKGHQG